MIPNIRSYDENMKMLQKTIAKMTQTEEGVTKILAELAKTYWELLFEEQRKLQRNCVICNAVYRVHTVHEQAQFCKNCRTEERAREAFRVVSQQIRARKLNLLDTLTTKEWLTTLDHFGWKCAYCQQQEIAVIEHFIPINLGGGTTANNCVPACKSCNQIKGHRNPYDVISIPRQTIEQVQSYLNSL